MANLPEVWEFPIPDGLVLALPGQEGLYFLNHTAGLIWLEVRSGASVDEAAARLASAFSLPLAQAADDVRASLAEWERLFGAGSDYTVGERTFRLSLDAPELEAEILPRLAHLREVPPAEPDFRLRRSLNDSVSATRALLLQEMVRLARGTEWLALLHAGACAGERGCVVFPAPSGSGKTTLAAALLGSGLPCHTDDSVGIERGSLLIPPMPFALCVREGSWPLIERRCADFAAIKPVERFGQRVRFLPPGPQAGPLPALALVFPRYEPGAATRETRLTPLETLLAINDAGFWVEHTREGIRAFLDCVLGLESYRIVYSDTDDAVALFRRLLI